MYVMTFAGTYLCAGPGGRLAQVEAGRRKLGYRPFELDTVSSAGPLRITDGPLAGWEIAPAHGAGHVIRRDGLYLSGEARGGRVVTKPEPGIWEIFHLTDRILRPGRHGTAAEENERFGRRAAELAARGLPVKIYCGAGLAPRPGFLNLDITRGVPAFSSTHFDDYFIFPFADRRWALPDDSADYIFHEDFIEHVDQTNQFQFLAEALRVMKPGTWQRVNTPNVVWTMASRSDFTRGLDGVYTGEREWGHLAIFSPGSLEETVRTVGYRDIVFTDRDGGRSPHAVPDLRPGPDRPDRRGNIFADLLK